MKTAQVTRGKTVSSESERSGRFGVDDGDLAQIFSILRNNLYSNKIGAVVREYISNAFDAHIEAGKEDVPVDILIPTATDPNFIVRDFGKGLSEDDIFHVFAYYGKSTKRHSDRLIGGFGIGAKSAFAYGDTFSINSYFEGEETRYEALIDETGIGVIHKVYSRKTKEPSGIKITVRVKPEDIYRFEREAKAFFENFNGIFTVGGDSKIYQDIENSYRVMYESEDLILCEYNKYFYDSRDEVFLRVGLVDYPLNTNGIGPKVLLKDFPGKRRKRKIIIKKPIPETEISASREVLVKQDKVIPYVQEVIDKAAADLFEITKKSLNDKDINSLYDLAKKCPYSIAKALQIISNCSVWMALEKNTSYNYNIFQKYQDWETDLQRERLEHAWYYVILPVSRSSEIEYRAWKNLRQDIYRYLEHHKAIGSKVLVLIDNDNNPNKEALEKLGLRELTTTKLEKQRAEYNAILRAKKPKSSKPLSKLRNFNGTRIAWVEPDNNKYFYIETQTIHGIYLTVDNKLHSVKNLKEDFEFDPSSTYEFNKDLVEEFKQYLAKKYPERVETDVKGNLYIPYLFRRYFGDSKKIKFQGLNVTEEFIKFTKKKKINTPKYLNKVRQGIFFARLFKSDLLGTLYYSNVDQVSFSRDLKLALEKLNITSAYQELYDFIGTVEGYTNISYTEQEAIIKNLDDFDLPTMDIEIDQVLMLEKEYDFLSLYKAVDGQSNLNINKLLEHLIPWRMVQKIHEGRAPTPNL